MRGSEFFLVRLARRSNRPVVVFLLALAWLAAELPAGAQQKSLLWKVGDGNKSVLLLGSIHYLRKENYPLNPAIMDAFAASKTLVLEIDLNRTSAETGRRLTSEKAVYHDGTTLPQNVSDETYQLASKRAAELGLDMRLMNSVKPWFAALTLVVVKLQALGLDPSLGVDRYLATEAKRRGMPTAGLETLEFQMGLFDQLSKKDQELMLRETVDELDLLDKNIDEIVRSWTEGDGDRVAKLLLAGMLSYPDIHQKIIVDRNRRWLPQIEKLMQQQSGVMIVVGAAHLVGQDGLIEMLKAKGYNVEQK